MRPPVRTTDPHTSHIAAELTDSTTRRQQVYRILCEAGDYGATNWEILQAMRKLPGNANMEINTSAPRSSELVISGLVEVAYDGDRPLTRPGPTSRPQLVYRRMLQTAFGFGVETRRSAKDKRLCRHCGMVP